MGVRYHLQLFDYKEILFRRHEIITPETYMEEKNITRILHK